MDYHGREVTPLITIVETPEFTADASRLMTDENREELIAHLRPILRRVICFPAREVFENCAGSWKVVAGAAVREWFISFTSTEIPLFLLAAFAKNEKTDLSQQQRNELRNLTKTLVASYRRGKR